MGAMWSPTSAAAIRRRFSAASGLVVVPSTLAKRRRATRMGALRRPPIHGDQDPMISLDVMFMAAEALAGASMTHRHLAAGSAHGIDAEGLRQGGLFLAKVFQQKATTTASTAAAAFVLISLSGCRFATKTTIVRGWIPLISLDSR